MAEATVPIVGILVVLAIAGFIPLFIVTMTGFLKISIVMFLIRNALGVQQAPPNLVLYSIAIILTVYVTSPLLGSIYAKLNAHPMDFSSVESVTAMANEVKQPIRAQLMRFAHPQERQFFLTATQRIWPEEARADLKDDDMLILLPAFVSSELTRAFEIGFLLYLPFLVIDLVVSNILMAMGMIMVSPTLISVPLKIFLFVAISGWSRLLHGLILSYS
jgi:type III secretion protein R